MDQQTEAGLPNNMRQQSWAYWSLAGLITTALLFGGGGTRFPFYEMMVQLAAIPAFAVGLGQLPNHHNWRAVRFPVILLFLAVGLAVLQIIPMPPAVWQALPGREVMVQVAELSGHENSWRAWSINPELSIQTSLSLIIPIAVMLCAAILNDRNRRNLLYLAMGLILVNLFIAFLQAIASGESLYLYSSTHNGLPLGLFANRNHTAQLFLVGMFLIAGLLTTTKSSENAATGRIMLVAGIVLMMTFSIVATNSRTVGLLLLPACAFLIIMLFPGRGGKRQWVWIAGLSSVIAAIFLGVLTSKKFGILNQMVERYAASDDHRFEFWPNALDTASVYLPFGSGLGTFDTVFRANEKLSIVGTHYVNNAHNDYLEIAIETGIFGPILIVLFLLWLVTRILRISTSSDKAGKRLAVFAAASIFGLLAHSMVDYPLRSLSIMTVGSLMLAIFAISSSKSIRPGLKN